jgi:hypothetical protein
MRKLILSVSTLLMLAQAATAQHTQTATGFANTCDLMSGTGYAWNTYVPDCSNSVNGGGGTNDFPLDEVRVQWGRDASAGYVYCMFDLTSPVDLTLAVNQKISALLSSVDPGDDTGQDGYTGNDTPLNMVYSVRLENAADPANPIPLTTFIPLSLTGTPNQFVLDLSGNIVVSADLTTVSRIAFRYDDCTTSQSGDGRGALVVSDLRLGSSVTLADVKSDVANASIALYPNPATSYATVEVNSVSANDMKITLTDMYGNVVKTVTAGSTSGSIKETFSTSDLRPGVYFVNYQVGNAATKTEKLVIQ